MAKVLSPQEQRVIKNKGRIIFQSENKDNRTQRIYDSFSDKLSYVDIERAKYFTQSFKKTEGQALVLRWAKALYHIAESIDIYIEPDQLIVGRVGRLGKYGLIYPELDGCFLKQFVEQARDREESPFVIEQEDIRVIEEEIAPYWQGKTYYEDLSTSLPEDVLRVTYDPNDLFSSRFIVNESSAWRSALQWVHDYKRGIDDGFEAIKSEALSKIELLNESDPADSIDKKSFYEAIAITCDAIILWADRHSKLASRLADEESDPIRQAELREIARITSKVPRYPAETFHEALQSQYFIQMFSRIEQKTGATISNGRMDQYLYPYYKKDLEAGNITPDRAKELFNCVWLGMAQYQDLYISPTGAKFNEGYAHWEAVTIGGVDASGEDATNDLSYILLENKRAFPLNYPDLAARIHLRSPEAFLREIAKTIRDGSGFPKLLNDEEIIPSLLAHGANLIDARDYSVSGCTEVRMPNLDTFTTACPWINLGSFIELVLNNGRLKKYGDELLTIETGDPRSFARYEDLEEAFYKQADYILRLAFKQQYIANRLHAKHFATPLGSSLHRLCMKNGQDLHSEHIEGGIDIGFFDFIGYGTAADSLAALKKLVYEDKTLTMDEVCKSLDNNFDGYEPLRQRLLNAPKYGNDDPYVDSIAKEIDRFAEEFAAKNSKYLGVEMDLRYVSQSSNVPFGSVVSATPNGRFAYTALSDGSSASQGADIKGPASVILSNFHSKNSDLKNHASRLLNIKLTPKSVEGPNGIDRLVSFIKTWRDLKLWHLQFNIINLETLLDARKNPENYRSLLVRVAGYSAYFVQLSPSLQEDIISRTEHDFYEAV